MTCPAKTEFLGPLTRWLISPRYRCEKMPVKLSSRLAAVFPLYFGEQPLRQVEIARRFGVTQSAISQRITQIRAIFAAAGIALTHPGRALRRMRLQTLSGEWRCGEYISPN